MSRSRLMESQLEESISEPITVLIVDTESI